MPDGRPSYEADPLWPEDDLAEGRGVQPSVDLGGESIWTSRPGRHSSEPPAESASHEAEERPTAAGAPSSSPEPAEDPEEDALDAGDALPSYPAAPEPADDEPADIEASEPEPEPEPDTYDDDRAYVAAEPAEENYFDDDPPDAGGGVPRYPGGNDSSGGGGMPGGRTGNILLAAVVVAVAIVVAVVIGTRNKSSHNATGGPGGGGTCSAPAWPDVSGLPQGWTTVAGNPSWKTPPNPQPGVYVWSAFDGWHLVAVGLTSPVTVTVTGDNDKPESLTAEPEVGSPAGVSTTRDSDAQWTITLPPSATGTGAHLTVGYVTRLTFDAQTDGQPLDAAKFHEGPSTVAPSLPVVLNKPKPNC